jgi:hypothetical protein
MAGAPHSLGEERATVPRIVLPITSRGLELTDRLCWGLLGVAMAVAAALILYLNRGTVFYVDELFFFTRSPETDLETVFTPVNGHLIAVQRAYTKLLVEVFGATYVPFRVLHVAVVLVAAGLFFALAKRRIGALPALAPTLVLLFLGSAWQHVMIPIGTPVILSVALGLAALLALEREDRLGDVAACVSITLSLATFSVALAFLVGIAVSVLTRANRWNRAWIFLVPLTLYAAWKLWSLGLESSEQTRVENVLLIPSWLFDSLALVGGALTGLNYDFSGSGRPLPDIGWGRIIAVLAIGALAWRISRGDLPKSLWESLAIALSYWAIAALAAGTLGRVPVLVKYVYPGGIVALLVATAAAGGLRFTRASLTVLFGVAAASLLMNIAALRDAGTFFRNVYSSGVQARLGALEVTRGTVAPGFNPFGEAPDPALDAAGTSAEAYFAAVDRYGSPALSPAELEQLPAGLRETVDFVLARALRLRLDPVSGAPPTGSCERLEAEPGQPIGFELPRGGVNLRVKGAAPAVLTVGRFADRPSVELGRLTPGETAVLRVPSDSSSKPWLASVQQARSVEVCRVG